MKILRRDSKNEVDIKIEDNNSVTITCDDSDDRNINICIDGNVNTLIVLSGGTSKITASGNCGSISSNGSCNISGDVRGNITSCYSVTCGNIFGSVTSGKNVISSGCISGNVKAKIVNSGNEVLI